MKQAAVNWLLEQLEGTDSKIARVIGLKKYNEIVQQAKAMEKEQIVDACNQNEFEDIDGFGIHETLTKGEQYYNETYGKSNS